MTNRLARLFCEALDRVDYAFTLSRCCVVDRIYGPEPATPADMQREAEHERLRKAFTLVDIDTAIAGRTVKTATERAAEAIEAAEAIFAEEMGATLDLTPAAKAALIVNIAAAIRAAVNDERERLVCAQ